MVPGDADGLIIEVHPTLDEAKSDGPRSLIFENFTKLMAQVKVIRDTVSS